MPYFAAQQLICASSLNATSLHNFNEQPLPSYFTTQNYPDEHISAFAEFQIVEL